MHKRQVLRDARALPPGSRPWIETIPRTRLEPSGAECPATRVRKPLSLGEVELASLRPSDSQVNPERIQPWSDRSVARKGSARLDEPAVRSLGVAHAKAHGPCGAAARTRPDPSRFVVIVRMQQRDMRIPCGVGLGSESKRMVLRKAQVVGASFVDERKCPRRSRVPRVREGSGLSVAQPCSKRFVHAQGSPTIV